MVKNRQYAAMVAAYQKYQNHAGAVATKLQQVLQDDTVFVGVDPSGTIIVIYDDDCNAFLKGDDYDKLIKLKPDAAFAFLRDRTG